MGLFGFGAPKLQKHVERVANKRAYAPERMESILILGDEQSSEAVAGLLTRFQYRIDPSITDQEEKEAAFQGICAAGMRAREEVLKSLRSPAQNVAWQLRILGEILSDTEFCTELIEVLGTMTTDYERDPEKKLSLIAALEEYRDARIAAAVTPFVQDASERVRHAALRTLAAQEDKAVAQQIVTGAVQTEDSLRVLAQLLDLVAETDWTIAEPSAELRARIPQGYTINAAGKVMRSTARS